MRFVSLIFLAGCAIFPGADGPGCPDDVAVFTDQVWEPVLGRTCVTCHGPGGAGSSSAFRLDPDDMLASLRSASDVADRLVAKPTGAHPDGHGGGVVIAEGSREWEALSFWARWSVGQCALPDAFACSDAPDVRRLRRLTHAEYDRTVHDLLGVDQQPGRAFAADPVVGDWHNDASALGVDALLADQYRAAAEEIAFAADLSKVLPCEPARDGAAACAVSFIEDFGTRAFRRPLSSDDIDRYLGFFEEVARDDGFDAATRWVIAAVLQSPHFLYRSELGVGDGGGRFAMSDWEVATALSYTFLGTTPDAALLAAANEGELSDPELIRTAAARLAADPRALDTTADMVEAWLLLDRLDTVSREGLTDAMRQEMRAETRALIADVAGSGGTLADLVIDGELFVQASVLTTHARPVGSSPVHRGVLVRERLLCEDLPPPPANLDTSPPEVDPSKSTRERYAEHASNPQCAECHDKIDPLGFAFEHYDQLGAWRDLDDGHPIDATGTVDGADFDGASGLAEVLLDDPRFRTCFVASWRRFATGAAACADDPGDGDVGLMAPLTGLVERESFVNRVGGAAEGDTFAVGKRLVPEPPDDIEVDPGEAFELTVSSSWEGGYCADAVVRNVGDAPIVWMVHTEINGTIYNIWNAEFAADGAATEFSGVSWNAELAPGAEANFGFCAET